jgi:hypothetical protein
MMAGAAIQAARRIGNREPGEIEMRNMTAGIMACAAVVAAAGCDSRMAGRQSILGVEEMASNMIVTIEGPARVQTPGSYAWRAMVSGPDTDVRYDWTVHGATLTGDVITTDEPVLSLVMSRHTRQTFDIEVTVRSGGRIGVNHLTVTACPAELDQVDWCGSSRTLQR